MKKNLREDIEFKGRLDFTGNWNYKNQQGAGIFSKPIGVVTLGDDVFVWRHEEIMDLIRLYAEADKFSIDMIKSKFVNTGDVANFETPFLDKLKELIKELEAKP